MDTAFDSGDRVHPIAVREVRAPLSRRGMFSHFSVIFSLLAHAREKGLLQTTVRARFRVLASL